MGPCLSQLPSLCSFFLTSFCYHLSLHASVHIKPHSFLQNRRLITDAIKFIGPQTIRNLFLLYNTFVISKTLFIVQWNSLYVQPYFWVIISISNSLLLQQIYSEIILVQIANSSHTLLNLIITLQDDDTICTLISSAREGQYLSPAQHQVFQISGPKWYLLFIRNSFLYYLVRSNISYLVNFWISLIS